MTASKSKNHARHEFSVCAVNPAKLINATAKPVYKILILISYHPLKSTGWLEETTQLIVT